MPKKKAIAALPDFRTPLLRYIVDANGGECSCGCPDMIATGEDSAVATGICPECGDFNRLHSKGYLKEATPGRSAAPCPVCESLETMILPDRVECAGCCFRLKEQLSLLEVCDPLG